MPANIQMLDIEREIEKKFVITLRAIFEIDDSFIYNEDDTKTKVLITPEYPEKGASFYTPHLVVTNMSYNVDLQSSFRNNYYEDVIDAGGRNIGFSYATLVPYNLNINCLAEFYVSKDLANKVMSYISFTAKEAFDYAKLNVQRVSKSPTVAQQQWAEHIFETTVSVQGYVQWTGTKTTDDSGLNILQRIKQNISIKL